MKTSRPTIVRPSDIKAACGYSRSHVYALEKAGRFPKRVKLGARASGWLQRDIDRWLEERIAASHQTDAA